MVELYLNMQNKRKADGVIDIEIAQNPLKTVFMTADVTAKNTAIASESLSVKITGKTYETKKIHT